MKVSAFVHCRLGEGGAINKGLLHFLFLRFTMPGNFLPEWSWLSNRLIYSSRAHPTSSKNKDPINLTLPYSFSWPEGLVLSVLFVVSLVFYTPFFLSHCCVLIVCRRHSVILQSASGCELFLVDFHALLNNTVSLRSGWLMGTLNITLLS